MPAGPSADDRVAEQLSSLAAESAQGVVSALTEQLAAGQSEALYLLQSAAATLRQRTNELTGTADALPDQLAEALRSYAEQTAAQLSASTDAAVHAVSTAGASVIQAAVEYLEGSAHDAAAVLRRDLEAAGTQLATGADGLSQVAASTVDQLRAVLHEVSTTISSELRTAGAHLTAGAEELSHVEERITESRQAFLDQATQLHEVLEARGQAVSTALDAIAGSTVEQIERAAARASADGEATARAVAAGGESIIGRLIDVLDERDRRDQLLEERLNARIERLTTKTSATVTRLTGLLADEIDRLEQRDRIAREATATDSAATPVRTRKPRKTEERGQ